MIVQTTPKIVLCNGADVPLEINSSSFGTPLRLEYEQIIDGFEPNIKVSLQRFITNVNHLPIRIRDLLEIAAYVFCADRSFYRGEKDTVEFHSWSRKLHFIIKVRDHDFWNSPSVKNALAKALTFMSGDAEYEFSFQQGRSSLATNLFDREEFLIEPLHESKIVLFSGGLDSLAGAIDLLKNSSAHLYLVSHRSSQPSTSRTQNKLVDALVCKYPNRVKHFKFYCSFRKIRARDENQRTRAFLYTSIAFALAQALKQSELFVYENGVTALNFPKREDMGNARASRTTHPKTILLLQSIFSLIAENSITIHTPFMWHTKADVMRVFEKNGETELISSAVSCSKTFRNTEMTTHCGTCSQCVDRRLSSIAASVQEFDHAGLYSFDYTIGELEGEAKTQYLDYVRWAKYFAKCSIDDFYQRLINELADVYDCLGLSEEAAIEKLYELHKRHGNEIARAIKWLVNSYYEPFNSLPTGSFLKLIFEDRHLRTPIQELIDEICNRLNRSIPIIFQKNQPKNENDFNDKVEGLLLSDKDKFAREYPSISFGLARAIPDHSKIESDLLIESKYLRNSTTPSTASEGIAADLTKYPEDCYLLFVVYDPHRAISDDNAFKNAFEDKRPGKCTVFVVR